MNPSLMSRKPPCQWTIRAALSTPCSAGLRDIVGPDTRDICYATQNRQAAVRELSTQVDVLLVVGATNSSNSNRLCEIGAETGVPSYLVADGSEVKAEWFANAQAVGHHGWRVSAGRNGQTRY